MKALAILIVAAGVLLAIACEDDISSPICACPPVAFEEQNLTERWHVLNNIEYAYGSRSSDVYDRLLNSDFVFYFSPGDVGGGIPPTWSRGEDLDATTLLFESNLQSDPPQYPVCHSMRLDLLYDSNTIEWFPVVPNDYPTETWYTSTVNYVFTFEMDPNITYVSLSGAKVQVTIRNVPQRGKDHWELVELRDLGDNLRNSDTAQQAPTWGRVKALYSPIS